MRVPSVALFMSSCNHAIDVFPQRTGVPQQPSSVTDFDNECGGGGAFDSLPEGTGLRQRPARTPELDEADFGPVWSHRKCRNHSGIAKALEVPKLPVWALPHQFIPNAAAATMNDAGFCIGGCECANWRRRSG